MFPLITVHFLGFIFINPANFFVWKIFNCWVNEPEETRIRLLFLSFLRRSEKKSLPRKDKSVNALTAMGVTGIRLIRIRNRQYWLRITTANRVCCQKVSIRRAKNKSTYGESTSIVRPLLNYASRTAFALLGLARKMMTLRMEFRGKKNYETLTSVS
ncbi:hypothetical protein V1477_012734 [Vespula maculifrons]|uniref:Uncharacterized protein n=1 Tax=Vespula maculifrons TaxID=7453 RepID=A0ABD2BUG6_VESMC